MLLSRLKFLSITALSSFISNHAKCSTSLGLVTFGSDLDQYSPCQKSLLTTMRQVRCTSLFAALHLLEPAVGIVSTVRIPTGSCVLSSISTTNATELASSADRSASFVVLPSAAIISSWSVPFDTSASTSATSTSLGIFLYFIRPQLTGSIEHQTPHWKNTSSL